jgi:formyltetrahydrofolate hydrolase
LLIKALASTANQKATILAAKPLSEAGVRARLAYYARGVQPIGAAAHFVSEQLDQGPIIAQNVIPTNPTLSARDLAQVGRDAEKITLARALKLVLDGQVFVHPNKTVIFD